MQKILFLLVCTFSIGLLNAQYFENEIVFDSKFHAEITRVIEDKQQNIVLTGYYFDTTFHYSGILMKVSPDFDTMYRIIGNDTLDIVFRDVLVTPDNMYFVIGSSGLDTGYGTQSNHIAVYLFDENLNMLSHKTYKMPDGYNNPFFHLWQSSNGRIYAAGQAYKDGGDKLILVKFEDTGDTLSVRFPSILSVQLHSILPKRDNLSGFYGFGEGLGVSGQMRMDVDTNLNYIVEPIEVNNELEDFYHDGSAKWLNDSLFLYSSLVNTDTIGTPWPYEDNILIKITNGLELTDEYITVGLPQTRDYGFSYNLVWETTDHIYVATFDAYAPFGQFRYFVAMVNEDLEILGTKTIDGGDEIDYIAWRMCATSDGGVICTGPCIISGANDYDIDLFVHKFMPGNIVEVAEKTANPYDSDYFIYPNPGGNNINILTARKGVSLGFYKKNGKLAKKEKLGNTLINTVNTSYLPSGIYMLRFTDVYGYTETIKWIKTR